MLGAILEDWPLLSGFAFALAVWSETSLCSTWGYQFLNLSAVRLNPFSAIDQLIVYVAAI